MAVANVDFHASVPAVTVTAPGTLVLIMGTSNGHLLLGDRLADVEGICGVVEDGVVPGLFGYEAGQSALGDIFAWFTDRVEPGRYRDEARRRGVSIHSVLAEEAASLRPGESGLLALDWWNGNRSVLVDADLRGLIVGMTLATSPPEIYRTLLEATAFGTRVVIEALERSGVPVDAIVACGGLPDRQSTFDADLRRRNRSHDLARSIAAGAGTRRGDVRRGRRRRRRRRARVDPRGVAANVASEWKELHAAGRLP